MATEKSCTLLIHGPSEGSATNVQVLRKLIEEGTVDQKIEALKRVIIAILHGEPMPQLLMYASKQTNKQTNTHTHTHTHTHITTTTTTYPLLPA